MEEKRSHSKLAGRSRAPTRLRSTFRGNLPIADLKRGTVTKFLAKIVAWITSGYPEGVPGPDRVPLFALLKRRLTDDEIKAVVTALKDLGEFDDADIGVLIIQITDALPMPDDVERVRERLAAKGWPLDDPRDPTEDA
jgi:Protein of unknown function (DUF3349)